MATETGIRTRAGIHLAFASRGTRFLGQMIDSFFATTPLFVVGAIARFVGPLASPLGMLAVAWLFFYLVFGDGLHDGQSFAKQWLGMRVVDAQTGDPCTFGDSFARNALSLLGPIDWIFIFGDRHQRLGDKMAGTIVVMAD
jgi:uncharacterized RDD family membrane protein YckC